MKDSRTINVDGIGPVLFEQSVRSRRIIISVRPRKGVRVAVPNSASLDTAMEFVSTKKPWIQKNLAKLADIGRRNNALADSLAAIDHPQARELLTARLKQLAEKHGFTYNRVSLRNQQTRWGSCSRKNNISLNYKLVVLPEELVDYVLLHELAHTRFHDHSKQFWAELDKYVGNGKLLAKKLRNYDTRWI
jgi:predicted metal-dependent hydrolase